jgi:hypothetical protein
MIPPRFSISIFRYRKFVNKKGKFISDIGSFNDKSRHKISDRDNNYVNGGVYKK